LPLTGLEQRGCWQEALSGASPVATTDAPLRRRSRSSGPFEDGSPNPAPARDFVPVELLGAVVIASAPAPSEASGGAPPPAVAQVPSEPEPRWAERTSLFGEADA
jgi:hypothetical protein